MRGAASRGRLSVRADDQEEGEYPLLSIFSIQRSGGLAARPGSCRIIAGRARNLRRRGTRMRVLLSTYGSRGHVEPLVGLAVRLRHSARMCGGAGARGGDGGDAAGGGGPAPARGRVGRRAVRHGRRGRCWPARSAGKGRQCPREPRVIAGPGPRAREPADLDDLNRQRPRGARQAQCCSSWPPGSSRRSRRPAARSGCKPASDRS